MWTKFSVGSSFAVALFALFGMTPAHAADCPRGMARERWPERFGHKVQQDFTPVQGEK